ncbi:MAG: PepSY-associated TM helix domain-containing protein [Acidobacteria bacterium]|nr:PepSY-associated TM helix domain-containing protein [Acidobacteriota bacterium]
MNWRKLNRAVHRDAGYFCAALTIVYAISGLAVNHVSDWNPNYKIERVEKRFTSIPITSREEMVAALVDRLDLPGAPKSSFRSAPHLVDLFYDGWSVRADAQAGRATIERPRDRALLRDANFLHLNHPKGLWTWFADGYAILLALLAISGLFILRGRNGITGRGLWFSLAGLAVPVVFVVVMRYL